MRDMVGVWLAAIQPANGGMDCTKLEWNPSASAPAHSALAGVLAGLVFAGIVVLFSDRNPNRQRTRAIVLFSGALLALAFDSFIFGVIAGEQVCAKAWTETLPAAGLMGLGALGIFGGISWLFNSFDDHEAKTTTLAAFITYTVAIIVAYHLQVTAASYLIDMRETHLNSPPPWLTEVVGLYPWLILVIVAIPAGRRIHRRIVRRMRPPNPPPEKADRRFDRAATTAAYLSIIYVIVVAGMSGTLLSRARSGWEPATPDFVVITATLASLAIPTLALVAQLLALPGAAPPVATTERGQPRMSDAPETETVQ